tara:strand:- start:42 stop:3140 length:3099 start_codon:yes stop_codon:yes gene_type:complete
MALNQTTIDEVTSAEISRELDRISRTSGDTATKTEAIKKLSKDYNDPDSVAYANYDAFNEVVAAHAAANGTTQEVTDYLNDQLWIESAKHAIAQAGQEVDTITKETELKKYSKEEKLKGALDEIEVRPPTSPLPTGESLINLTSQTHQCILTHYLEPVAAYHRTQLSRAASLRAGGVTNTFLAQTIAPDDGSPDAKIILVDDSSADSSVAPVNAVTSLGKTNVDGITPAQLANTLPLLRLYKIYREEGIEKRKIEFKFDNKTDIGFLEGTPEQKLGEFVMDAGYAKGRAAGIKSFNWSFIGGDPFTATRDLTATLKIFFQDFRDLTKVRTDSKNLFDPNDKNIEYKYLDLVVQPDCRDSKKEEASTGDKAKDTGQNYDIFSPDCYEIAIEVGYAPSPDLPAGLKNQTDTLYLTMVEHSFDIGQDGTFELTIEYRARLAQILGDKGMNVLEPGGGHLVSNAYNGTPLTFDIREVDKKIETERKKSKDDEDYSNEELDALESVKSHLLHLRNNSLYRNISETLLINGLIYTLPVPTEVFAKFANFDRYDRDKNSLVGLDVRNTWDILEGDIFVASSTPAEDRETAVAAAEQLEAGTKEVSGNYAESIVISWQKFLTENIYFTTVGNLIAVALDHVTGDASFLNTNTAGSIEDLLSILKEPEKEKTEAEQRSAVDVDEAEAAQDRGGIDTTLSTAPTPPVIDLKGIDETRKEFLKRFRIILGAVTYVDAVSGSEKTINLAHLPVSMQMFRQFMIDRVISQRRSFYSFQDFVKDILTDIIFDSLNRICFGGYSADDSAIRPGISLISGQGVKGPDDTDWAEPITSNTQKGIYEDRTEFTTLATGQRATLTNQSTFKTLNLALANQSSPIFSSTKTNKAKDFNYLMFSAFSVGVLNSRLHGNRDKDADNGIAHFRYGSTKGLMKSVSFSKTPLEFAAEERYVREGTDNLLNQLAGRYEMQMSLVGNNMFIPGQYVYFDPVALGIGKTYANSDSGRSLANLMGLGGYHIITEVGNSISPGKFETTIKALWETGGTKEK